MRVTVVANCQSYPLSRMILEVKPDWDVAHYSVHIDDITRDREAYRARIGSSDVVLMQPIQDGYRNMEDHCSSWIRSTARNAAVLTFPSLFYSADHPTQTILHANGVALDICERGGQWLYGLLAVFALHGVSKETAVRWMLSPDAIPPQVIGLEREATVAEARRRERHDLVDLTISPFYDQHAGRLQIFHIPNHPKRLVLSHIAREFFGRLGEAADVDDVGEDYFASYHFPPLPSLSRYYETTTPGCEPDRVLINAASYTLEEYLIASADAIYGRDSDFLAAAVRNQWLIGVFTGHFEQATGRSVVEAAKCAA